MTACAKCGGAITFKSLPSCKWLPVELDGSEHWDICKQRQRAAGKLRPLTEGQQRMREIQRRHNVHTTPERDAVRAAVSCPRCSAPIGSPCVKRKANHIERVSAYLEQLAPVATVQSGVTHVWCGDLAPWDESLGEFRDFSPDERAALEVCRSPVGVRNPMRTDSVDRSAAVGALLRPEITNGRQ